MIATVESTVTSAAPKLPPSARDLEIYQFVKFACHSTRVTAQAFGISQTRVRQVIARVVEYLVESVPPSSEDKPNEQRLFVAEQLAWEQLDYLYQRAIRAFDETRREDVHGNVMPGRVSYLAAAARITMWMARVPVHPLPAFREEDEPVCGKTPPVADCSVSEVSRGQISASVPPANVESALPETSCKSLEEIKAEALRNFLRPAQAAVNQQLESPASGDGESPGNESPGVDPLYARTPLNRRERRAREQARKRMMGKR